MAGASIDAIGVINQIKGNLNDRYDNGFDVLKEIIQNSDDAGSSSLKVGWSQGFEHSDNELLNAPAIFFINNAPLEEEHKDAILSIAQSSKAASKSSVGKFGLGMKSLFHLGEAFFFQSNEWRSKKWAAEVFNPWDRHRNNWNTFTEKDKSQIENRLSGFFGKGNQAWFVVWIPLRTQQLVDAYDNEMIIGNISDGEKLPIFFEQSHLAEKTAEILPQLKHLTEVSFYRRLDTEQYDLLTKVVLEKNSQRSGFVGEPVLENSQVQNVFSGAISATADNHTHKLEYLGCESILSEKNLSKLKTEEMGWPKSYQLDKLKDRPIEALDKAEQHCAVTVSRVQANSQAYLRANWAVFLPLKDTEELVAIPIEGAFDYNFYLHGYFFVDAGRKSLQGHDLLGQSVTLDNIKNDEKRLREVWNVILASEGTFNLVLKALSEFSTKYRMSSSNVEVVTSALQKMFKNADYLEEVTKDYHFLFQVTSDSRQWNLLPSSQNCLPIPKPNNNDYSRIWATLPGLVDLQTEVSLFEKKGCEFVSSMWSNPTWNEEQFEQVLQVNVTSLFEESIHIEYLYQFIQGVLETSNIPSIDRILIQLCSRTLSNVELTTLSNNRSLMSDLMGLVNSHLRVDIPIEKDDGDIWRLVCSITTEYLFIPRFLASPTKPSQGKLAELELIALLRKVDNFLSQNQESSTSNKSKACERLIRFVIDTVKSNPQININDFYSQCADLKLVEVENINGHPRKQYLSRNSLFKALESGQVFTRSDDAGYGLGAILSKVVPNTDLLFIKRSNVSIIFEEESIAPCDSSAALKLLSHYPEIASPLSRIDLIKKLDDEFEDKKEKKGFRYLLHGSSLDNLQQTLWKPERRTKEIWMKVWLFCQPEEFPSWAQIPIEISDHLTRIQERSLNVEEQSFHGIIRNFEPQLYEVDYSEFSNEEINDLLLDLGSESKQSLWCKLPIHTTISGEKVSITENCLMEGVAQLPSDWDVRLIALSPIGEIAKRQQEWINNGSPSELLNIALAQTYLEKYGRLLLELLISVKKDPKGLTEALSERIKKTKWIPLKSGQLVAPELLLSFNKTDLNEAYSLCHVDSSNLYTLDQVEDNWASTTEEKNVLKEIVTTKKIEVSTKLLSAASINENYALGEIKNIDENLVNQLANLPEIMRHLPGWQLLYELSTTDYLDLNLNKQHMLAKSIESKTLRLILEQIASLDQANDVPLVRLAFLEALCCSEGGSSLLPNLKLKNLAGNYVDSRTLVANVGQVVRDNLIDPQEYSVIEKHCEHLTKSFERDHSELATNSKEIDNSKVLELYFSSWEGRISHDAIAMFLAIFSSDAEVNDLCCGYLKNTNLDSILKEYHQKWAPVSREPGPFSGFPFKTLIQSIKFELTSSERNMSYMTSIYGERIQVKLTDTPDSILVHQKSKSKIKRIELRTVDPKNTEKDTLLQLLASGIELIFSDIFGNIIRFESDMKSMFGSSEQMDIQVTKKLVLEQLVPMLDRLRVRQDGLAELLNDYRLENRSLAIGNSHKQDRTNINKILEKIQAKVESNLKIQSLILGAVRNEVSNNFQYTTQSVIFELFQNADDAVSELIDMNGDSGIVDRFDVNLNDNHTLDIFHWGRELNYCRSKYAKGRGKFDRDLEKMVSLNVSDKAEGTTGKFGLGFKSTLLISDTPIIVSGDICTVIKAGIFPTIPESEQLKELNLLVDEHSIQDKVPTMIRLPLSESLSVDVPSAVDNFKSNAGLLSVFSRHIKEINISGVRFKWNAEPLLIPEIGIGSVKLPVKSSDDSATQLRNQKVICITTQTGQFIFALSNMGVVSLAERKGLSSFWVLNPLKDALQIGFLINAPFAVDIGRSQLANEHHQNESLMSKLGEELSDVLVKMHQWAIDDWNSFSEDFELESKASHFGFWDSMWKALTDKWPDHLTETNSRARLIQKMFLTSNGILDFYHKKQALPCKLIKKQDQLVSLDAVKHGASRLLTEAFSDLAEHDWLASLYNENSILGYEVYKTVKLIQGGDVKLTSFISLETLLNKDFSGQTVSADNAKFYGRFFDRNFEKKMESYNAGVAEKRALEELLDKLKFENRTNGFVSPKNILVTKGIDGINKDEVLLAKFAPDSSIASLQYDDQSSDFIVKCRREAAPYKLEDIVEWTNLNAVSQDNNKQQAVCRYILDGKLGLNLAEKLKSVNRPKWIFDVDVKHLQTWGWSNKDIDVYRNERMISDAERSGRVEEQLKKEGRATLSAQESLMNIYEWWEEEKGEQLKNYEEELYPGGYFDWLSIKEDETPERFELAWLKLFFLGSCQTIGRSKEVQHRAALESFDQKGWWKVFSDPKNPKAWFDVMDQYLSDAITSDKYRTWLQILPLYRFSSNLTNYIDLFWSADNGLPKIEDIIQPGSSSNLTGAGSSFTPPELKATLGIGANFILRELYRHDIYSDESLEQHCFVVSKGVRNLLQKLPDGVVLSDSSAVSSKEVYQYLCEHMGKEHASFNGAFDIPLRILSRSSNSQLLESLLDIGVWS